MTDVILSIKALSYTYPNSGRPALNAISLDIKEGSSTLIVGKSGCGKSTLARCLNGLIPHFFKGKLEGQVTVAGKNTAVTPVWQLAKHVGLVFQNTESQLFTLTVEDEVAFGPENFGLPRKEIRERLGWALNMVDISNLSSKSVLELSDGQKQRVVVASNISCLPEILVFDEPTSNLDPQGRQKFLQLLKELKNRWKKTLIIIDHRLQGLKDCVDEVVVMQQSEIKMIAAPAILTDNTGLQEFGLRLSHGTSFRSVPSLFDYASKQDVRDEPSPPLIAVDEIGFAYDENFALRKVSFEVRVGEIVGLVGRNGSGKTTLLKMLVGLLKPDSGKITMAGLDTRQVSVPQLARKAALVLQNPDHQLFMSTVYEEVSLSPTAGKESSSDKVLITEEILRKMNLWDLRHRHPHSLSEGQKQRTTIATALARQPTVLILDEPTTGMDGYHLALLKTKIRELNVCGLTVILASHDPELIFDLCHRVILLDGEKVVGSCNAQELSCFFQLTESEGRFIDPGKDASFSMTCGRS